MTRKVELFVESQVGDDALTLDDLTKGELGNSSYPIGGGTGAEGTPVDITDQCVDLSTRRGRSRELDVIPAGTANVSLRNFDRDFDPEFSVRVGEPPSGNYGDVRPGKRVRISDDSSVVFDGIVEDWEHGWHADKRVDASLTAVDALGKLGRQTFLEWQTTAGDLPGERIVDALDRAEVDYPVDNRNIGTGVFELQGDLVAYSTNVLGYLQLVGRTDAGVVFASRDGVLTFRDRHDLLTETATVEFGEVGYLSLTAGTDRAATPDSAALSLTGDFAVVIRLTTGTLPGTIRNVASKWVASSNDRTWAMRLNASNAVSLLFSDAGTASDFVANGPTLASDTAYWYAFTFDSDNGSVAEVRHWLSDDGIEWRQDGAADTHSSTLTPFDSAAELALGGINNGSNPLVEADAYLLRLYDGIGDNSAPDLGTLVAEFDAGRFDDGAAAGATSTDHLGNVWTLYDQATVTRTGIPFRRADVTYGSELLFTQVTIARAGGEPQTVEADGSVIAEFGVRPWPDSTPLLLDSDDDARKLAEHYLREYEEPDAVVTSLTVILDTLSAADRTSVVELDIGELVRLDWTPTDSGAPVRQLLVVEGVEYRSTFDGLTTVSLALSDASSRVVFVLDDEALGVLDDDSLAF